MREHAAVECRNLPAESTPFLGRRREVGQVRRLLSTARLVTLTGVGGSGKSRLALRIARQGGSSATVAWAELTDLTDGSLLEYAVAGALGIHDRSDRSVAELVEEYLRDRDLLLVLDNCEHVLDACAGFVDRALRTAARLRVLCTSRQPLGITGEHVFTVLPLEVPDPARPLTAAAGSRNAAVALFVQRASAVEPHFELTAANRASVAAVCRRLDGLPLAIELAAARVRTTPIDMIAAELRDHVEASNDRPALVRHHALEAVFDWSYTLCSPAERALWARISVFAGSFTLDAVERVCGADLPGSDLWEPLAGLVDKSVLLREEGAGEQRYRLLDTVRQYGLDRLRAAGDGAEGILRRRHRDWYVELAERFHADWFGPRQPQWTRQLSAELPNLRAVLAFCLTGPDGAADATRLAGALTYFWFGCGAVHEGRYWLQRALAADRTTSTDRLRATAVYGWLLLVQGDRASAATWTQRCLEEAEKLDEPLYAARATADLGCGHFLTGDLPQARARLEDAVERLHALDGAAPFLATAQAALALVVLFQHEPERANKLLADCRDLCRAHGERLWLGHALAVSATVATTLGEVAKANRYAREGLQICLDLNDPLGVAGGLERLAWVAAADRNFRRAARLLGAADRQWRSIGQTMYGSRQLLQAHERCAATTRESLGDATYRAQFRRGAALTPDNAIAYALREGESPGG